MSFSFRIRLNKSPTDTIQLDSNELDLTNVAQNFSLKLRSSKKNLSIRESGKWALVGEGYDSAEAAKSAGRIMEQTLMIALARVRIGADFGYRAPKGHFTEHGLRSFGSQLNQNTLNDVHGLMVFPTSVKPKFLSAEAKLSRGVNADQFQRVFGKIVAKKPKISERELLSYTLFNSSFFQPTADSRFLLLIMAIEALIEPLDRSTEASGHVEKLVEFTKQCGLPRKEKESILGSLRWLKKESINQAGRRMVLERLGKQAYQEMEAPKFFSHCYQLRSNLVHGNIPIPSLEEIGKVVAVVENFVSDLLTNSFIKYP